MLYDESIELACAILGLDYDNSFDKGLETAIVDEALYNKFGIGIDQFHELAKALLPFTLFGKFLVTGELYHCFFVEKNGLRTVMFKQKVGKE